MTTKRLEIGGTLVFESTKYETGPGDASFEFVEHSPDHWFSDRTTEVSVDAAMAQKIIDALKAHFGI